MESRAERFKSIEKRWTERYPDAKFTWDGIICEEKFAQQERRILFVAREPNDMGDENFEGDFRVWWNQDVNYLFANRVGQWAYSILHSTCKSASYNQKLESLKSIAFINLKKQAGKSYATHDTIKHIAIENADLLIEQINLIYPNIIIGCFGYSQVWKALFPNAIWEQNIGPQYAPIGFDGVRMLISYYHPSARKSNQFLTEKIASIFSELELVKVRFPL